MKTGVIQDLTRIYNFIKKKKKGLNECYRVFHSKMFMKILALS